MSLSLLLSMSAFALVASISPGPVNMVCLGTGARHGMRASLGFVSGATIGFIALFIAVGLGSAALLTQWPMLTLLLRWSGIGFLLFLSWQLVQAPGDLTALGEKLHPPGFISGALMQWLNPKAWLAAAAGIGAYTNGSDLSDLGFFAMLYAPICWLSLALWAYVGAFLKRQLAHPAVLRRVNRGLALLLVASCVFLLMD